MGKSLQERIKELRALVANPPIGELSSKHLAHLMSLFSEQHWSAGWASGLEYILWGMIIGEKDYSEDSSAAELLPIALLAQALDGWVIWTPFGDEFVPMTRWLELYGAWH